jgi:hypothetical protein
MYLHQQAPRLPDLTLLPGDFATRDLDVDRDFDTARDYNTER